MTNQFFLIFLATIVIVRIFVYLFPIPAPTIGKFRTHHYMFGIAGMIAGFFTGSIVLYAIGLGLFVDELTYLLIGGRTHEDNYSKISLLGTLFFVAVVFVLRGYLIVPFGA